ncbi:succinate dehydrogenase/fumarate reductase iron-sulfur subunit [Yimella sp. cx-51]|uniref:succinate dehydrogenase/fumarate reductase iron-sulfur subunit n=1 Tax=Yimella sp. cx-51 TaxID=2770551 RepID=UPI00165E2F3A|nr:succinate dehydrogenase/fumarate reductase iron-sulfur subunit [Yimella sp. cx-51]MBC9955481.1 succinate dehydrogenase/fumarate reductase iron-sulfur subunit [Yimella sp. cx-51]QTH37933.1 succinate dehydrogenase/fumarate reductase iron-sulfur subunit [Yimella sp. cx-51]
MKLKVWRQAGPDDAGRFETHELEGVSPQMSLLELLDVLNDQIAAAGGEPIAFESDCREGICGACGVTVDGMPHGPVPNTPSCRQHLRAFGEVSALTIEPLRSAAFPVVRDLVVDRSALDELVEAGGFVSLMAGTAPDADALPVTHEAAEEALDFAACIGCGACVAACPNGAAHLYAGAKLAHLALLPQPALERGRRAVEMTNALDEQFGPCSTYGECAQICPAGIPLTTIAVVSRERARAKRRKRDD